MGAEQGSEMTGPSLPEKSGEGSVNENREERGVLSRTERRGEC